MHFGFELFKFLLDAQECKIKWKPKKSYLSPVSNSVLLLGIHLTKLSQHHRPPPPPHMCSECHMIRVKCTKSLLFAETLYLCYVNSSVCPGHQPPDAQLCHPDVAACALELVLRRHGGVLRSLLQAGSGGHAGRQHLCAARYNTTTHTSSDVGISWSLSASF